MELWMILFFGGISAGILGGILGIGGGILLMPILRFFVGLSPAYAAGTCVVAVFFTTLGGSYRHYKQGHIDFKSIIPVISAGALSTLVFSLIFLYFTSRSSWLDLGTGVVFSLVSIRMMVEGLLDIRKKNVIITNGNKIQGSLTGKVIIGSSAGILPGMLGIGTGAVLVPAFTFMLNAPIKIAVGSSLACFSINAFLSSIMKIYQGFTDFHVLIPICLGTLAGSYTGAKINRQLPSPVIKIVFGVVFVCISIKYFMLF